MGGPTQGKAVAIPLPSLQLLERCVGKGVNRSFKNRQVAAARLIRRVAEAKPLITAADVFFQVTRYAADAGKPARAGIIPANKNTNRLVVIPYSDFPNTVFPNAARAPCSDFPNAVTMGLAAGAAHRSYIRFWQVSRSNYAVGDG